MKTYEAGGGTLSYMLAMEKLRQELADMARKALLEQYPFYDVSLDPVSAAVYYGMQQEAERQREAALLAAARNGDVNAAREYARMKGDLVELEAWTYEGGTIVDGVKHPEERYTFWLPKPQQGGAQQGGREMNAKLLGLNSKSSAEQIVAAFNNRMRVGDYISGDNLEAINPKLSKAGMAIKKIERVKEGFKVSLTATARFALKFSPFDIKDGAIFKVRMLALTNKDTLFGISSSQSTMYDKPFNVFINNNIWSDDWKKWYKVWESE